MPKRLPARLMRAPLPLPDAAAQPSREDTRFSFVDLDQLGGLVGDDDDNYTGGGEVRASCDSSARLRACLACVAASERRPDPPNRLSAATCLASPAPAQGEGTTATKGRGKKAAAGGGAKAAAGKAAAGKAAPRKRAAPKAKKGGVAKKPRAKAAAKPKAAAKAKK